MSDDHDGIEEHDHHLPSWWLATLFGSIVFAFFYWMYFETLGVGATQQQALAADTQSLLKQRLKTAVSINDELLAALSHDATAVAQGREIFASNCMACHGSHGEGVVGPNLTDAYWLHGGKPVEIHQTISNGVIEKGMLAWATTLGESKVRNVVAYLLTLKNTNVAGKAPQGEKQP